MKNNTTKENLTSNLASKGQSLMPFLIHNVFDMKRDSAQNALMMSL